MFTTSIPDFRKDIKRYLDRETENFETLIIHRAKDSSVVMMSLDEYNSLNVSYHELSSKSNENRLDSAIEKPEPLKYKYKGFWSRRIDSEHRLIYQVKEEEIWIAKCRFHYE